MYSFDSLISTLGTTTGILKISFIVFIPFLDANISKASSKFSPVFKPVIGVFLLNTKLLTPEIIGFAFIPTISFEYLLNIV